MAVLVAGCGYVGNALASSLVADGVTTLGLRRNVAALPEGVKPVAADLTRFDALRESIAPLAESIDVLVYCAAADGRTDEAYADAYVVGLDNVLRALEGSALTRVLFTSSTAVYDQSSGWVDESSLTEPSSFSGLRLLEGEKRLHEFDGDSIVLRLSGIYGPGRTRLVQSVAEGGLSADRYTNRIHRDDCAGALRHLVTVEAPASTYVGVDDAPAPLSEVAAFIAERLEIDPPQLDGPAKGKRCRNQLLVDSGYSLKVPTFREGYPEIVDAYRRLAT